MFVCSVKSKHIKICLAILFVVVTIISLTFLSLDSKETAKTNDIFLKANTPEERLKFISQYGWDVDTEPVEVREVIIPTEFDDTYKSYNEIQLAQGFDLSQHMGERAKRWSYTVKNYKGYENKKCILANILTIDGVVVGGDVCSVELDGFMHGFSAP